MSRTFKTAAAALALAAMMTPAALAQTAQSPRSFTVDYDDLDMSTAAGGETLLARIESAARKVCGDSDAYRLNKPSKADCRRATVARAVEGLGFGRLTQAFNGGQTPASQLASRD